MSHHNYLKTQHMNVLRWEKIGYAVSFNVVTLTEYKRVSQLLVVIPSGRHDHIIDPQVLHRTQHIVVDKSTLRETYASRSRPKHHDYYLLPFLISPCFQKSQFSKHNSSETNHGHVTNYCQRPAAHPHRRRPPGHRLPSRFRRLSGPTAPESPASPPAARRRPRRSGRSGAATPETRWCRYHKAQLVGNTHLASYSFFFLLCCFIQEVDAEE